MTIGVDTQSIGASVMARLVTDSAGATIRAALGSSSLMTAIAGHTLAAFDVSQLSRVQGAGVPPIWAAFDRGSATGRTRVDMRNIPFDWWFYDAPQNGAWGLEGITPMVDALYSNVIIATGRISVDLITNPMLVSALGMWSMRARLFFTIWR